MIWRLCWLIRLFISIGALASVLQAVLCAFGHVADMFVAMARLHIALGHLVISMYSMSTGRSKVFEIRGHFLGGCALEIVKAMCVLKTSAEWNMEDIVFNMTERPHILFMMMCMHTLLDVVGHAAPDWVLGVTWLIINVVLAWKTLTDVPSAAGIPLLACVAQVFIALALKGTTNALLKERDVLKRVREDLQQNLDSQDSMWKSVFDATFHCNSMGCVSSASAQAMDLFQFESTEALVGRAFSSLAVPDEEGRLARFVHEVQTSPSSQAMVIQGTFTQGNGSRIELQVNAIRAVQSISDSSSEGASGVLLGMRQVDSPGEKPDRPQSPEDDESSVPCGREESDLEDEDMWILFDAGDDNFAIMDYSPNLCLGSDGTGLLRWFPPMARQGCERWVVDTVQACGVSGTASSEVVEHFQLRIPAVPARSITAKKAWLEAQPMEVGEQDEVSLPVVLRLRGEVAQQRRPGGGAKPTWHKLQSVPEDGEECEPTEYDEQQSSIGSEDLTPSDSNSVLGLKFRLRPPSEPTT